MFRHQQALSRQPYLFGGTMPKVVPSHTYMFTSYGGGEISLVDLAYGNGAMDYMSLKFF